MDFDTIGSEKASWLEREFSEEEVREVVFKMSGDKPQVQRGFLSSFFRGSRWI